MCYVEWSARRHPQEVPQEQPQPWGPTLRATLALWPIAVLILAVLGSLFAGIATPTESAAVGVAAATLLGFTMGDLTWGRFLKTFMNSARTFAVIALVFMGAVILAQSISVLQIPQKLLASIASVGLSPLLMLALVMVIYLLLGMVFDGLSMMVMTLPVVFPLLTGLGFDAVWLGVVVTMMIEVGMLTPPVGMNLFVLVGISKGKVNLGDAAHGALPFWLLLLLGVLLLTWLPGIATWLPGLSYA
jgi:tripartite ATP-independent transporter DctM subunit